jgi:glyoxylase-like metal-dependent hydrolase (beta-lactamase superfamily II)
MRRKIGAVTVTRVVEREESVLGSDVLPEALPENLVTMPWLAPRFLSLDGMFSMSIHALVVESDGRKIIVDTGLGNDKRLLNPHWNALQGDFLQRLQEVGHSPETIDTVLSTHLHVDHVGWNTKLVDGRWVPTFPSARYIMCRTEWDFWADQRENPGQPVMTESVKPVIEAGMADLVEGDHMLTSEVWLEPTPGHTPGHVSVRISSRGEEAVITGDVLHHPSQVLRPEWTSHFDWNREMAHKTRHAAIARWSLGGCLVIGTHFAGPTAGRIVPRGDSFDFAV